MGTKQLVKHGYLFPCKIVVLLTPNATEIVKRVDFIAEK
jgi:hypothetical protein